MDDRVFYLWYVSIFSLSTLVGIFAGLVYFNYSVGMAFMIGLSIGSVVTILLKNKEFMDKLKKKMKGKGNN